MERGSDLRDGLLRTLRALRKTPAIEVVASGLVAIMAIGIFGAGESLGLVGPRVVASAYLQALASGDATKAARLASVGQVVGHSEDATLLDLAALRAQIAHGGSLGAPSALGPSRLQVRPR